MLKEFITCSGPPASSIDSITSRRVLVSRDDRVRVRDVRRLSALGKAELENKAPAKYDDAYVSNGIHSSLDDARFMPNANDLNENAQSQVD